MKTTKTTWLKFVSDEITSSVVKFKDGKVFSFHHCGFTCDTTKTWKSVKSCIEDGYERCSEVEALFFLDRVANDLKEDCQKARERLDNFRSNAFENGGKG